MRKHGPSLSSTSLAAVLVVLGTAGVGMAMPAAASSPASVSAVAAGDAGRTFAGVELAQADEPRELQPRYEPVEAPRRNTYNDEYIFGLTRGIADSTLHPAAKILLFPMTVPLDLALLPFEAIGGLF